MGIISNFFVCGFLNIDFMYVKESVWGFWVVLLVLDYLIVVI